MTKSRWMIAAAVAFLATGLLLVAAGPTPALAQAASKTAKTPENFAYDIVNGRRVPRGKRVTNPDGSWREEIRDGACVTIREQNAAGEYRETRRCD